MEKEKIINILQSFSRINLDNENLTEINNLEDATMLLLKCWEKYVLDEIKE